MGPALVNLSVLAVLWGVGWWLACRLIWASASARLAPTRPSAGAPASLSIIIPARNEQQNLPRLLRSIFEQATGHTQVIVADDNSTDDTAAIARDRGATVIPVPPLADGWRGKTWACHHGAQAATGDVLLFLDADTWLEPGALLRLGDLFQGGALSVGPHHAVRRPYEQLSAMFNLLMVSGTIPDRLFGQMLMIDRASYDRIGGHAAVRGHTLENFHLARRLTDAGLAVRSMPGRGLLAFRMYPGGLGDLCRGWTRGFASGATGTPVGLLLAIIAWLTGMTLAVALLATTWHAAIAYALFAGQLAVVLRHIGSFRWYTSVLYPAPLLFFYVVFTLSVLRRGRTVTWKGRAIRAD